MPKDNFCPQNKYDISEILFVVCFSCLRISGNLFEGSSIRMLLVRRAVSNPIVKVCIISRQIVSQPQSHVKGSYRREKTKALELDYVHYPPDLILHFTLKIGSHGRMSQPE